MKRLLRASTVAVTLVAVAGGSVASASVGDKKNPKPPVALTVAQIRRGNGHPMVTYF